MYNIHNLYNVTVQCSLYNRSVITDTLQGQSRVEWRSDQFFLVQGVVTVCQSVYPIFQDVSLIVECRKTHFCHFHRVQNVIG